MSSGRKILLWTLTCLIPMMPLQTEAKDYYVKKLISVPNGIKTEECRKYAKTKGAKVCVGHKVKSCVKWAKAFGGKTCIGWKFGCSKYAEQPGVKICVDPKFSFRTANVYFVVSGPDTKEQTVRRVVEGIIKACSAAAISKALAAAAAPPDPATKIAVATATFTKTFKGCVLLATKSATPVAGAILNQLSIGIRTKG